MPYNTSTPEGLANAKRQRLEWYYRNRQHVIDYQIIHQRERKRKLRKWFFEHKSTLKCKNCGMSHPACLQFHHRDKSVKERAITQCVSIGWSIKKIRSEISKCDVLCANCHFILHWDEKHNLPEKSLEKMIFVGDSDHEPEKEWIREASV